MRKEKTNGFAWLCELRIRRQTYVAEKRYNFYKDTYAGVCERLAEMQKVLKFLQ